MPPLMVASTERTVPSVNSFLLLDGRASGTLGLVSPGLPGEVTLRRVPVALIYSFFLDYEVAGLTSDSAKS